MTVGTKARSSWQSCRIWLGLQDAGQMSGPLGLILLIAAGGGLAIYGAADGQDHDSSWTPVVLASLVLLLLISIRHLHNCCRRLPSTGIEAFRAYNLGLSIVCVAYSIIAVTVLTILVAKGDLPLVSKAEVEGDIQLQPAVIGRVIWVSGMVAALGACFYCLRKLAVRFGVDRDAADSDAGAAEAPATPDPATAPAGAATSPPIEPPQVGADGAAPRPPAEHDAQQAPGEGFVAAYFWSGLWFRVAQAEVYTLVVFLAIWGGAGEGKHRALILGMPLLALIMGLFIRAAEELVAGSAERLFAVVRALLPREGTGGGSGGAQR